LVDDPTLTHWTKDIKKLKPLFIDFGRAKRIEIDITTMYDSYNFRQLLGSICAQGCANTEYNDILHYPDIYGWASGLSKSIVVIAKEGEKRGSVIHKNNQNVERYLLALAPPIHSELEFFGNSIISHRNSKFTDVNINVDDRKWLDKHFDGEQGLMHLMILTRNKSNEKIMKFKEYISFKEGGWFKRKAEEFQEMFYAIKPHTITEKSIRQIISQREDLQIEDLIVGIENLPSKNPIEYINSLITNATTVQSRYRIRFPLDTQVNEFINNMTEYLREVKTQLGATVGGKGKTRRSQTRKRILKKRKH